MADPTDEPDGKPLTLREHGAQIVAQLGVVGAKLHPLKMRLQAGESFGEAEQAEFEALETEYRELEREMRSLMRPRPKDDWVRGVDHLHGPEHPRD